MSESTSDKIPIPDIVVDGDLSLKRLLLYIELGREEERLDYKRSYDLEAGKVTKDQVEIARDVAAMHNTDGGYIILGIDEVKNGSRKYTPVGISQEHLKGLDIDRIKPQIEKYLEQRILIKLQIHYLPQYGNKPFGIIYVPPFDKEPVIFAKDSPRVGQNEKNRFLFKSGDIFVRKGASSVRVTYEDMRRFRSIMRRREKEEWTEEILSFKGLTQKVDELIDILKDHFGKEPRPLRAGKVKKRAKKKETAQYNRDVYFWGPRSFYDYFLEILHNEDEFLFRQLLINAPNAFYAKVREVSEEGSDEEISKTKDNFLIPLLDNLTVLGLALIQYRKKEYFQELIGVFYQIYSRAKEEAFPSPSNPEVHFSPSWVWQETIKRVYAVGAILVWFKLYEWIPIVVQQRIDWDTYWSTRFWSRHALTMLAREKRLKEGLIQLAATYIKETEMLSDLFYDNYDDYLNAICQFDFVQCVHAVAQNNDLKDSYPIFGRFYNYRTEPIISKLIKDKEAKAMLPKITDEKLAEIILGLDTFAGHEFFRYAGWDTGIWSDNSITEFLSKNRPGTPTIQT